MRKLSILLGLIFVSVIVFVNVGFSDIFSGSSYMYRVTLNTTTFTSCGETSFEEVVLRNPGTNDIQLASATTTGATSRFVIAGSSLTYITIKTNGPLYAIATDSHSVILDALFTK